MLDPLLDDRRVRDEEIVAHELDARAQLTRDRAPARHVVFAQAVLDGDDRVAVDELLVAVDHLLARERDPLAPEPVAAARLGELARRGVECQHHVLARPVAGALERLHEEIEGGAVAREVRREAALVAHARGEPFLLQQPLERVEDLGGHAESGREVLGARGDQHELLEVEAVVGVGAAVQDVDHRHRHEPAADAPEIGVEREPRVVRRRPRDGERDREDRVGTERRLVRRAVELEQRLVHGRLLGGLHPLDLGGDRLLDVPHGPVHASSLVALTITVA